MNTTCLLIISALIISSTITITYAQNDENHLPAWVKDTAKFWADDSISDSEFFNMISFLIENKIIIISGMDSESAKLEDLVQTLMEESMKRNQITYRDGYTSGYRDGMADASPATSNNHITAGKTETKNHPYITKQPQANNVTRTLSDGTLVQIYTSKPATNEKMSISVDFIDALHVNYDLRVKQDDDAIVYYKGIHIPKGAGTYTTPPLHSSNPIDLAIIFAGYGIDERTGPIGDIISLHSDAFKITVHDYYKTTIKPAPGSGSPGCEQTASGCFIPGNATVTIGNTVVFSNTDTTPHTFTSGSFLINDGTFDTFILDPGESFEWIPSSTGKQPYFCVVHPWMTGIITVQAAKEYEDRYKDAELLIPHSIQTGNSIDGVIMYVHPPKQKYNLGDTVQVFGKINPVPLGIKMKYDKDSSMHEKISTRLYLVDESGNATQVLVSYCYLDTDGTKCASGGKHSASFIKNTQPYKNPDGIILYLNTFEIDEQYAQGMYYITMSHSITSENLGFVKSDTFMIR